MLNQEVGRTKPRSLLLWRRVSARSAYIPERNAELSGDFLPKHDMFVSEMDRSLSLFVSFDCDSSSEELIEKKKFCA